MKNPNRKPQVNFEAKPEFIAELKEVAAVTEIPVAQIAREGTRARMDELKRQHPNFIKLQDQSAATV